MRLMFYSYIFLFEIIIMKKILILFFNRNYFFESNIININCVGFYYVNFELL